MKAKVRCITRGIKQQAARSRNAKGDRTRKKDPEDVLLGIKNQDDTTPLQSSLIIFAGTCRRCQEIHEIMTELEIESTILHGMMSQQLRSKNLAKFKNQTCTILIATDVASRGLDIPEVDLVINLDLPRVAEDYVHRVGRTARAGKRGVALSLVTQFDVEVLHGIEEYIGIKLQASDKVTEDEVVTLLNVVSRATRVAQLRMLESGFDEKDQSRRNKKGKSTTFGSKSILEKKSAGKGTKRASSPLLVRALVIHQSEFRRK